MEQTKLEIAVVEDDPIHIREYKVLHDLGYNLDLFFTGNILVKIEMMRDENPFYSEITVGTYDEITNALTQTNYDLYLIDGLFGNLWKIIEKAQLPKEKVVVTSDAYGNMARDREMKACKKSNLKNILEIL